MPIFKNLAIKHTPVKEIMPRFVFCFSFMGDVNFIQDATRPKICHKYPRMMKFGTVIH